MDPKILLLDEPLASLDPASAHEALQVFRDLADEGYSVMMVEHRVEDVLAIHPGNCSLSGRRQSCVFWRLCMD